MSKYIASEYLENLVDYYLGHSNGAEHYAYGVMRGELRVAPAADVVELDSLWKCETCANHINGKCLPNVWCENGECYRPSRDKLTLAEEKRGRWYLADDGDGLVCGECGQDFCVLLNEVMRFKYCPNCGAYMRETYGEDRT